jgi:predicted MPP superfamily phosphohydrolase
VLIAVLVGFAALAVDGFWIEPNAIQVTHWQIRGPVTAPLKIAHLTDLHTRGLGGRERHMLAILAAEQPDLIVVTGDSLVEHGNYQEVHQVLAQLRAPLGVWVVRGNWENWYPVRHESEFYRSAGVHFLLNSGALVRPDVWLGGVDDPWSGHASLEKALAGAPPGVFTVLLFHAPGYFDRIAGRVNLALAGHTHGGQVRLPFIPVFWLPGGCGRFLAGWYEENGSRMYVSRGVGMSHFPVRFLCPPEIAFITVLPEAGARDSGLPTPVRDAGTGLPSPQGSRGPL